MASRRFLRAVSTSAAELQHTLSKPVARSGVGLHSGKQAKATLFPAAAGKGRYFTVKSDHGSTVEVQASAESVLTTTLSTCIGSGSTTVCTIEHILSALETLGINNCHIQLEGSNEVPLLDGSALPWVEAIEEAGTTIAKDEDDHAFLRKPYEIKTPLCVHGDDAFVAAFPAPQTKFSYGIDFSKYPAIGTQWFSWTLNPSTYRAEVAPARTFGFYEQLELV